MKIIYSKESYELCSHKTYEQTWVSKIKWPDGKMWASGRTNYKKTRRHPQQDIISSLGKCEQNKFGCGQK